MLPILQIGPLAIQTPGLILLIGLWIGLSLAERTAPQYKIKPSDIYNLAVIVMIFGILGARLTYLARFPSAFAASPRSLISLNPGILDPLGGAAVGLIAGVIYGQRKKMPLWQSLDTLSPGFAMIALAMALANLASGNNYGTVTDVPWAVELWGASRHPTQIYELVYASFVLWVVWPGRRHRVLDPAGGRFLTFLALSAGGRVFLEAFRAGSPPVFGGIRIVQIVGWVLLGYSLLALERRLPIKEG